MLGSRKFTSLLTAPLIAVAVAALSPQVHAFHSWGNYHWARTANPFTIVVGDNLSTNWKPYLQLASTDWSKDQSGNPLNTTITAGAATKKQCGPQAGRVEVCNRTYGNNGWLGLAQIWASGDHITQGAVKLNDTYFNTATYNSPAWRQMVTCQEIGHTFGLDHQDENFSNLNLNTCMDYTNNPTTNQHPNDHDYFWLGSIYAHLDSFSTLAAKAAATSPGAADTDLNAPQNWGKLVRSTHQGRKEVFERDLGGGQKLFTFVTWADDDLSHRPR